jgi:hypothetical protein
VISVMLFNCISETLRAIVSGLKVQEYTSASGKGADSGCFTAKRTIDLRKLANKSQEKEIRRMKLH